MHSRPFTEFEISIASEALDIAEDRTGEFYKFSFAQWKRHRYDVKTFSKMNRVEMAPHAFALLNKCSGPVDDFESKTKKRDFYLICLHDRKILGALDRDRNLHMLPILVYIFTHELIHIVRFCNFSQRFEIKGRGREREEQVVHETTFDVLKDLSLPKLDYVLESYQGHRICDLAVSYS